MTKPFRVTITGADDEVRPSALQRISEQYHFVEWGILVSSSRQGSARYPSAIWRDSMAGRAELSDTPMSVSWHLCGSCSSATLNGSVRWVRRQRVQINGYLPGRWRGLARLARLLDVELILQCSSEAELGQVVSDAERIRGASVLFDPSAGTGTPPERWPQAPWPCKMGFAGGITPDNVLDVVAQISSRRSLPFWIDMESGVRTPNDKLDFSKVRSVLDQVASL